MLKRTFYRGESHMVFDIAQAWAQRGWKCKVQFYKGVWTITTEDTARV
ncbi:hypothetical protein NoPa_00107 [Pseudomonas phage vB_PpuM-NoPa]|uniref:Uncharacterized protein n=4 Tax=Tartuvirus TaxID=3424912 RepID=A0AAX4MXS5_9CAUD